MLILCRHGQTAANAKGLLLGRADLPLTDIGRAQAAAQGLELAAILGGKGARLLTSPLQRCRETAAAYGAPGSGSVEPETDDRWIELDYGAFDGRPAHEVPSETWAEWRVDPQFTPPGGESLALLGIRVRAACEQLAPIAAMVDVVVVSHVSPIKAAVAWALGVGDEIAWRTHLDVASITRIAIGPAGPSLRSFNETQHLAK